MLPPGCGGGARMFEAMSLGQLGRLDLHRRRWQRQRARQQISARAQSSRSAATTQSARSSITNSASCGANHAPRCAPTTSSALKPAAPSRDRLRAAMLARVPRQLVSDNASSPTRASRTNPGVGAPSPCTTARAIALRVAVRRRPTGSALARCSSRRTSAAKDALCVTVTYVGSAACARCHEPATTFCYHDEHRAGVLATLEAAHQWHQRRKATSRATPARRHRGRGTLRRSMPARRRPRGAMAWGRPSTLRAPAAAGAITRKVPEAVCSAPHVDQDEHRVRLRCPGGDGSRGTAFDRCSTKDLRLPGYLVKEQLRDDDRPAA